MPTKTQAKAAVDTARIDVEADIDNILPVGVNIKTGSIAFAPENYNMILDAGGNAATALSWANSIISALTTAGRTGVLNRLDRRSIDASNKVMTIDEAKLHIIILNF